MLNHMAGTNVGMYLNLKLISYNIYNNNFLYSMHMKLIFYWKERINSIAHALTFLYGTDIG